MSWNSNRMNLPFKLIPAAKDYLWGGNRLNDDFEKNIDNVVSSANKRFSENLELNLAESEILGLDKVVEKISEEIKSEK